MGRRFSLINADDSTAVILRAKPEESQTEIPRSARNDNRVPVCIYGFIKFLFSLNCK